MLIHSHSPNPTGAALKPTRLCSRGLSLNSLKQDPFCEVELCSSLCSLWCPTARTHDWQPQLDADRLDEPGSPSDLSLQYGVQEKKKKKSVADVLAGYDDNHGG